MILAHTIGVGGPDLEMMVLAAALVMLGIILFVQKTAKPAVSVGLMVAALAVGGGAFAVGGSSPSSNARVAITSPPANAEVKAGEPVTVEVAIKGGELTSNTTATDPNLGHLHVFIDDKLVSMPSTDTYDVTLKPGDHDITVEFTAADHRSFEPPIRDSIVVIAE